LTQFYDSDGFAAAFLDFGGMCGYQGMGTEKFGKALAKGAGAVAVDDAYAGKMR
jgi:hypothetical protein